MSNGTPNYKSGHRMRSIRLPSKTRLAHLLTGTAPGPNECRVHMIKRVTPRVLNSLTDFI